MDDRIEICESYRDPDSATEVFETPEGIYYTYNSADFFLESPYRFIDILNDKAKALSPEGRAKYEAARESIDITHIKPDKKKRRWIVRN